VRRGGGPRGAQHPLDVRGDAEAARAPGAVLDAEPRDLHRVVEWDELCELERDPVRGMPEATVALPVTAHVGPRVFPDGQERRAPESPGLLVAHVEDLTRRVGHRIVRPGRELVLAAVLRPELPGAGFRHL